MEVTHENTSLTMWYDQINELKQYLITIDPKLEKLFDEVDRGGFQLHSVMKKPFPALIGAIIGQKISYKQAKELRSLLYANYGTDFTPHDIHDKDLSYLGASEGIIKRVTKHMITHNMQLKTEEDIKSLKIVKGIGDWTIETTLLTCLTTIGSKTSWDLFPLGDKFLQNRIKKLYGGCDIVNMKEISQKWSPFRSVVTWYLWRWF